MKKLRQLHLYLGCFFAPMLLFFAVSGIWQTNGWYDHTGILKALSAIHTAHQHKGPGWQPTSPFLQLFVMLMALGLIFSIVTGIVMAFKFGRGRMPVYSLAAGVLIPALIILFLG